MIKKGVIITIFWMILIMPVFAQEETGIDAFEEITAITPPSIPGGIAKVEVAFALQDFNTKQKVNNVHIEVTVKESDSDLASTSLFYIGEEGILSLHLVPGTYKLVFKIDDLNTPGKDYFASQSLSVSKPDQQTLDLLSVGSLRGLVFEGENAIKGAQIKTQCSGSYGDQESMRSDAFGSYAYEWLPVGTCRISAEYNKQVGFKDIEIKHGILNDEGDVFVKGEDALGLYSTREIIKAIGRGFNPETAKLLLKQDYSFELVINY